LAPEALFALEAVELRVGDHIAMHQSSD
jgi:hypothetical protein